MNKAKISYNSWMVPQDIKEFLSYDPTIGLFVWMKQTNRFATNSNVGSPAGWMDNQGYRKIEFRGKVYGAARLAWYFVYGEMPANQIDHIDRNKSNDRISNLRPATQSENHRNRKCYPGSSRYKGVHALTGVKHARTLRWRATIQTNGCRTHLGCFAAEEEAARVYEIAAKSAFGEFAYLNFPGQ